MTPEQLKTHIAITSLSARFQAVRTQTLAKLNAAGMGDIAAVAGLSLYDSATWKYLAEQVITQDTGMLTEMTRAAAIAVHTPVSECVMIHGPTGTGKELFARAFAQPDLPFVAINCTSLPDYLVESELFGHKAGAFTGAVADKVGLFEAAGNGVLFLDEIGDMPLVMQAKLLRVLQQRRIRRVGENNEREIKCRVVAATHACIERSLREDLRWRLSTYTIKIKHLANRVNDAKLYAQIHAPDVCKDLVYDMSILDGNYRSLQAAIAQTRLSRVIARAGTPPAPFYFTVAAAQAT